MARFIDLIGETVGSYRVERHLARGGMADVYVARDTSLQRDVILKVLLPTYIDNEGFVERFRREALAMARLEHPNIVQVYGTGVTADGRPYIAMQYVQGGTLEEKLVDLEQKGQVMTVAYALATGRQVAAALQTAHDAGIVHRDMKPSNILLDNNGKPILTDLGIAYVVDDARLTRTDVFLGTPHYMSPEQARGATPDFRSDVYAMGVVLFEMLAGQRPFDGESHFALIHQHASEPPPPLKKIRPGLSRTTYQTVDRALQKDPDKRYQTAAELMYALDNALEAEGVAIGMTPSGQFTWQAATSTLFASRTGLIRPLSVSARRPTSNRTPLIAGLMVVLAVAAGLVAWLQIQQPANLPVAPETVIVEITSTPEDATSTLAPTTQPTSTPARTVMATSVPLVATAQEQEQPSVTPTLTVTASPAAAAQEDSEPAGSQLQRVVARSDLRAFAGPSNRFAVAFWMTRNAEAGVIAQTANGVWLLLQDQDGEHGWVPRTLVDGIEDEALNLVGIAVTIPALPTVPPSPTPASIAATPTQLSPEPEDSGPESPPTSVPEVTEQPPPTPTIPPPEGPPTLPPP